MRESVQVFIAPPDPAVAARAPRGPRHRLRRGDRRPARGRRAGAGGPGRVRPPGRQRRSRARRRRAGGDRARRARPITRLPRRMIKPRVDKLLEHADSHYAAVVVSAKRARQINSYFHNLGEGGFGEYPPPMVETNAEQELPLDGARRARRGQAQIRVPHLAPRSGATRGGRPMARILLGVSGGIAAYKALELARLATLGRPRRAGADDRDGDPLRRRRLLRGDRRRPGADLRVRARPDARRLPRRRRSPATTRSATSSWPPTATPTSSRRPRPTRSPSSPPASPTRC